MPKLTGKQAYDVLNIPAAYDNLITSGFKELGIDVDASVIRDSIQKLLTVQKIKESPTDDIKHSLIGPTPALIVPEVADKAADMLHKALSKPAVEKKYKDIVSKYVDLKDYMAYLESQKNTVEGPEEA